MKQKKHLLKKIIIFGLVFILFSCEKDLYDNYLESNKHSLLVQRKNFEDLKQDKVLMKSIEKFTLRGKNSLNRQHFDSINNFYIDLDDVMFTLDSLNNQTYTFKINRIPDNGLFENLILKSSQTGDFDAVLAQYNQNLFDLTSTSPQDIENAINQYTTFTYLGKKTIAEINNKFSINEECFNPSYVYVPGNKCASGEHVFSQGTECDYYGNSINMATPGSYVFTMVPISCNNGGSEGATPPTNGSFSTGPHGGGGGGSPNNNLQQTPCETLNDVIQSVEVSQAIQNLKTQTLTKGETGYEISKKFDALLDAYTYGTKLKIGDNFSAILQTGGFKKGGAHNHPINSQFIPSIGDVKWLKNCQNDITPSTSNAFSLIVCPNASSPNDPDTAIVYAITVDNLEILQNEINNVYGADFENLSDDEKKVKNEKILDIYSLKFKDVQNSSTGLENKFLSTYANFGISLYKLDSNNNWNKLNLVNNTVTPQPCE